MAGQRPMNVTRAAELAARYGWAQAGRMMATEEGRRVAYNGESVRKAVQREARLDREAELPGHDE